MPASSLSRRSFLGAVAAGTVLGACGDRHGRPGIERWAGAVGRPTTTRPLPRIDGMPFTLGVASGDPRPDSVILWTRLAPQPTAGGGMPDVALPVTWEVGTDERFGTLAAAGVATASPRRGHSVHVDATGLDPARDYWYRFRVGGTESPVGRTRTAPAEDASPERLRFAFASCQDWRDGYWTAYPHLAQEDLDVVLFLGDYIYEGGGTARAARPGQDHEAFDLDQYRNRYGLYKSDPGLRSAHAAFPWVVTWDDHEVDNGYAGASNERGRSPARFLRRRAAAYQAWYEHMPVRLAGPPGPELDIHRRIGFGDLATFHVLDLRQHRARRTMLGAEQERWLLDGLAGTRVTWDVLTSSVLMARVRTPAGEGTGLDLEQWDRYPRARQRVLDRLAERDRGNALVVTGDVHASVASDLLANFDDEHSPVVGSELVGTSVSSSFGEALVPSFRAAAEGAPWVRYQEPRRRGYVRCELVPDGLRAQFRHVRSVAGPRSRIATASSWSIEAGRPGLQQA